MANKYSERCESQLSELESIIESYKAGEKDGWISVNEVDGASVSKKDYGGSVCCAMGEMDVKCGPGGILDVVWTEGRQSEYDDKYDTGHTIEEVSDQCHIQRQTSKRVALVISPRESIALKVYKELRGEHGGYLVAFKSIEHEDAPETDAFVRVNMIMTGYKIIDTYKNGKDGKDDDMCHVYHCMWVDAGGMIPKRLAGMFVNHVAGRMSRIRKLCEQ